MFMRLAGTDSQSAHPPTEAEMNEPQQQIVDQLTEIAWIPSHSTRRRPGHLHQLHPGHPLLRARPPGAALGLVGIYDDTWLRTAAGWRITRRRCRLLGTVGDLVLPVEDAT